RVQVAKGDVAEAGQQRFQTLVILWLPGGAEGAQGAAMETIKHADDLVTPWLAVEPGQLDRRFDRLGAAVAEEALPLEAAAFAERLGQQSLCFGVPGVRHVDELAHLFTHRRDDTRRTMAEQVTAPAREEIEVALALGVPDQRTLAAHQADGVAGVIADDMSLEQVNRLLRVH